jgi:hypothetical protein
MNFRLIFCLLFVSIFFQVGCKKDQPELVAERISLPVNGQVRCIYDADSLWLIAGGNRDETGFLLKTSDFETFELVSQFDAPIYSMTYFQDRFVFGSVEAEIFYSNDLQEFYPHYPLEEYWINTPLKQPLYEMLVAEDKLLMTGGEEILYGLILTSVEAEGHNQYQPHEYENALRSLAVSGTGDIWAVGNGIVLKSIDKGESWDPEAFNSDYLTSVRFDSNGQGLMSTFGGAVYSTSDNGAHWDEVDLNDNSPVRYLRKISTNSSGNWIIVGNNAVVLTKAGNSWKEYQIPSGDDLHEAVFTNSGEVILGGEGAVYRFVF